MSARFRLGNILCCLDMVNRMLLPPFPIPSLVVGYFLTSSNKFSCERFTRSERGVRLDSRTGLLGMREGVVEGGRSPRCSVSVAVDAILYEVVRTYGG